MPSDSQPSEPPLPNIRVLAQYAKSVSFDSKDGVQAAGLPGQPNIELGIDVGATAVQGGPHTYETNIKLMARAHVQDETIFEIELVYAGIFDVSGAPEAHVEPILMIECPRLLFPFARRVIADITREGGFPPLLIDPVDFAGLYNEQVNQASS